MSLPTCWCLFVLNRVAPAHRIGIQYVQIIARNDFLEGFAATIVATEQVDLVTDQVGRVTTQALRWAAEDLRLSPCQRLCVKDMQVFQVLVARVTTEEVKFVAQDGHRVGIASHWNHA